MGYFAVDFDGTLVTYDKWRGADHCGEPIGLMCDRVRRWLKQGRAVRIFTARAWPLGLKEEDFPQNKGRVLEALESVKTIQKFCVEQFGQTLSIQCWKDMKMIALFDDRAVQVEANTGILLEDELESTRARLTN